MQETMVIKKLHKFKRVKTDTGCTKNIARFEGLEKFLTANFNSYLTTEYELRRTLV